MARGSYVAAEERSSKELEAVVHALGLDEARERRGDDGPRPSQGRLLGAWTATEEGTL